MTKISDFFSYCQYIKVLLTLLLLFLFNLFYDIYKIVLIIMKNYNSNQISFTCILQRFKDKYVTKNRFKYFGKGLNQSLFRCSTSCINLSLLTSMHHVWFYI